MDAHSSHHITSHLLQTFPIGHISCYYIPSFHRNIGRPRNRCAWNSWNGSATSAGNHFVDSTSHLLHGNSCSRAKYFFRIPLHRSLHIATLYWSNPDLTRHFILLIVVSQSSSEYLTQPTIFLSIFCCTTSNFSKLDPCIGNATKPNKIVGLIIASNSLSRNFTEIQRFVKVREKLPNLNKI